MLSNRETLWKHRVSSFFVLHDKNKLVKGGELYEFIFI